MFLHMQTQVFHHKKQTAQQALNNNLLQQALELYTEALQIAETLPHLFPEIPKILSNRSLVYYKLALDDANRSTNLDPFEIKGYWRAAQAHKKLGQVDCALDCTIRGYNVSVTQDQEEEILRFLVEIVLIIITLRYDPKNLLKNSKIRPSSFQTQRKLLQRLASNNCWEGVSLLVMGTHAGPPSTLDASASSCPIDNISVGNLLKNTSITELKRFGVDLAVCLLKSGASCEDIEQKMEEPVIHVGLKVALDTGNISLIKLMFSQYLKTPETKDALDREGRTAFHVLVHSGKINDSIGETLLRLLINNGCQSSIPDRNGKLAIDYLTPNDLGFSILSTTTKVAGSHVKVKVIEMKEKGNAAFKNREYEEALIFYNRAISMMKGYENLTRETALVLTNRSIVHSNLHNVTEALEDAEEAVRCDPTWMKGHLRRGKILRQKNLFQESFSVFLEGCYRGNGTHSEKCNILVEAVASFSNITEKQELEASYKSLRKVSSEAWPEVLSRLSARGEWAAIRCLVLGIDFQYINGQVIPSGIARDADLQGITYSTLFQYLESQEDPASLSDWITPLVLFLIIQRGDLGTLLRFQSSEEDTPFTAAVKFCVLTEDIALLQYMPDNQRPEMMEFVDGRGDSPFHTLFKMSRCPQGKLLATIVRLLLQKGVSPEVHDRSRLLPIDYVNPSNNKEVYGLLKKYTQPTKNVKPVEKAEKKLPEKSQTSKPIAKPSSSESKPERAKKPPLTKTKPKVQELKSAANEMFKKGAIPTALDMYTYLLEYIFQKCQGEVDNHEIAVIYGSQAECLLKMGLYQEAFNAAIESVSYDGHWFKSHLRVGKVQAAMGRFEGALQAFGNACQELEGSPDNFNIRLEILAELASSVPKEQIHGQMMLLDFRGCNKQAWAVTACNLIARGQWDSARFAYFQHYRRPAHGDVDDVNEVKVNVQPLCDLQRVVCEKWVIDLINFLIVKGADYHTISLERGDTYFHAVVQMTLVTNIMDLFMIMLNKVSENNDQNLQDSQGNTALHAATRQDGAQPHFRFQIISILLEIQVNPMMKNKAGKHAVQYLPKGELDVVILLHKAMADQEAKEREIPRQKQRQEQEKQRLERLRQQEEPQRQKEEKREEGERRRLEREEGVRRRLEREEKERRRLEREEGERRRLEREEADRKRQLQNQRKAEEARKIEPIKIVVLDSYCKEYCEPRIDEAKALLQENNMRHAYLRLAEVLKKDHMSEKHNQMERKALDIVIISLGRSLNPVIPDKLAKIPHKLYEQIINGLAANEKWKQMYFTVKEHRIYYGDLSLPNFAKSMSLDKVIRHSSFQGSEQLLVDVVDCMLNGGAVLDKEGKFAILAAVQECQFKVLEVLLKTGANPVHLTINQEDTPVHAALSIALKKDKAGNVSILNYFFDLYERDPENYPMLDPTQTNSDGDSLFHLVAKANYSATTQKATELLFDKKVKYSVLNKEGKLPKDYLSSKNDRRLQFFWFASVREEGNPKKQQKAKTLKIKDPQTQTEDLTEDEQDLLLYERQENIPPMSKESKDEIYKTFVPKHKKAVKRHIEEMVYNLPDIPYSIFNPNVVKMDDITNFRQTKEATKEKDKSETMDVQKVEGPHELGEEQGVENEDLQIDPQVFENLHWEIECTDDVWKTLRDKKVPPELKQKIIRKIQLLAKGEWTTHLCKELKNIPPTLKLYEVKLSKASRIIWELAIAFSPRLSEDAEQRLQYEGDKASNSVRIYSEVIRVWDIVFDHDKIFKSVQRIIKSHSKWKECIIQKKLQGIEQDQFKAGIGKRLPMVFAESDLDVNVNILKEFQESLQRDYPSESSNETEYNTLKFHRFDSNLVSQVLHNLELKVDFPFRVTDLEHDIINLKSNAPILLLGRSGTGKTTCCLYRLWSQFVSYWTGAAAADSKLLPRCQMFQQDDKIVDDEIKDFEEDTSEKMAASTEETENEKEVDQLYDHLHQVFITKNSVLCSEVHKKFKELSRTRNVAGHFMSQEEQPLPHRIQDIGDNQFPIFITFKKLLLMLDASLKGPCFFDRRKAGSIKQVEIQEWSNLDESFIYLPMLEKESADADDKKDQYQDTDDSEDNGNDQDPQNRARKKVDQRREVTFEVFVEEFWSRICTKWSTRYHPSLIWTEIMSFIRGSFEALSKPSGYLSKKEYLDLGRKRAPNFSGEREHIYDIFQKYDDFKRQKILFDESDLVQNVFNRLNKDKEMKWILHQIYVDETQDFTQAELCLLLRLCHSPNEMFLTGNTIHSNMGGIALRFEDLRSLLFHAKKSMHSIEKSLSVKVPKKFYELNHNYQSQARILSLASSIEDLMLEFFPESFDRLKKDQGQFNGPLPVLLESCSFSDLATLLRGNKRKTSKIEFGAHQAILVVNEAARDNIPDELNLGLILTIYEAKGLAFDDILLYNFFKDSEATNEWRVVTNFQEKLVATNEQDYLHISENWVSVNTDFFKPGDRPRPLTFDPNRHKVLNLELKHLFTAVTRARVNVWIFDEDHDKREPMFEYFKARKLIRNITSAEVDNESTQGMFAEESSTEQWLQKGGEFMKHSLYEVAAKCFNRGKNYHMEKIAKAHQSALLASRMKDTPAKMKEAFLLAAEQFLECEQPNNAVICLKNSGEKELVACLYEKLNQLDKAGKTYRKLARPIEESRCYEQLGKFNLAVKTLVENGLYEMAIDTLRRYKCLREEPDQQLIPPSRFLIENAPSHRHTVESLSYKAAEAYHRSRNKEKMIAALERLPNLQERTDFLIRRNYIEEAAKLLQEAGLLNDAIDLYTKKGMNKEALQCAEKLQDKNAIAQSLILDSKIRLGKYKDYSDIEADVTNEICENLNQAFYSLQDLENKLAAGEAALLTGELTGKTEFIIKAYDAFSYSQPRSEIGQLECIHWMVNNSDLYETKNLRMCVLGMQNLFGNLFVLAKHNMENERMFEFFGFYPAEEENKLVYYPKQQPRALLLMLKKNREVFRCTEDRDKIREKIFRFLEERGVVWKRILEDVITNCRNKCKQCLAFRLGEPCKNSTDDDSDQQACPFLHAPLKPKTFYLLTEYDMLAIELEVHIHHGAEDVRAMEPDFDKESRFISKDFDERYKACSWLLEDLIPQNYHNAIISSGPEMARDLMKKLRYSKYVKKRMIHYLESLYDEMETSERKDNVKVFVLNCFVIHLLDLEMKPKLDEVMSRFEDLMNKECSRKEGRRKTEWTMKLGLMISESDGKIYVRSIARMFCEGCDQITGMNNNSYEALIKFTKFCALLGNTGSVEILPHYNQLLLWMEYYITVAFCLNAKVQNTPNFFFVIPESYIAVIHFIDATFVQERGVPTFEAIQRHRPRKTAECIKLLHGRIKRLIEIICGLTSTTKINLLSHIFQSNNPETPIAPELCGIAERLLVLSLVLVCNLGKSVYPVVETKLMSELCKIKVREEYPSRLSEALKSVQQARSPADAARALQILLSKRENDLLRYCIWENLEKGNVLRKRELKAMELNKKFFLEEETLQAMKNPYAIVSSTARTEIDKDDEMDTPITMEEKMEIDRIRKGKERSDEENEASEKITQFMRRFIFCSKAQNLSELVKNEISKEKSKEKKKLFEYIKITNTGCGICGVQFKERNTGFLLPVDRQTFNDSEPSRSLQSSSPLQLPLTGYEMMQQIQTTPSPDKVMDNPFALLLENPPIFMSQKRLEDANQETREKHENSEKHKEMVKYYQHFRLKYMLEISNPLGEVRGFIHRHKLGSPEFVEKHFKEKTYYIGVLCRQRESVEIRIESIIKECDWQNKEIWEEAKEMTGSFHLIKDYVETEARKRKERLDKQREADLAKNMQKILDDDSTAIEPVVETKERRPKGQGKRKWLQNRDHKAFENKTTNMENEASKKITLFMRKLVFRIRVQNLSERVKCQIKEEKMNIFNSIQITNTRCGICGVQFRKRTTGFLFPVDKQTSNDSKSSGSLQLQSPLQLPHPDHKMMQQIQTTLKNPPMFMSQKRLERTYHEIQEEHKKSEKHKEMVKYYQHFRLKYMREISDPLDEIRGFIQRHKLGSPEFVQKHFKEETYMYYIGFLCRQRESVEIKIESIIKECDWQNGRIWREVQEMIGSYHLIKDYVETQARERKERSDTRGGADSDKDSQQILDDDMEAIEPVVYEPKERRRKGTKKKKTKAMKSFP